METKEKTKIICTNGKPLTKDDLRALKEFEEYRKKRSSPHPKERGGQRMSKKEQKKISWFEEYQKTRIPTAGLKVSKFKRGQLGKGQEK